MYRKSYIFLLFVLVFPVVFSVFGCSRNREAQQRADRLEQELMVCRERVAALNDTTMALRDSLMASRENFAESAARRDSLQEELDAFEDSLQVSQQRMEELRNNLEAQRQETAAVRESARQQATQRQAIVRRDVDRGGVVIAARSAQIDSLMRTQEALEDSLSACEQRLADMTAVQDSLETAMGTGDTAKDNRIRTLSILLVAAAAAFVVSLVWAVVKK